MRFLITGAGGYIGSILCDYLTCNKHAVVAVDRPAAVKNLYHVLGRGLFQWVPGDTASPGGKWWEFIPKVDVVIPLAALVGQSACSGENAHAAYEVNRDAVMNLVGAMKPHQSTIYLNTNSGYGCGQAPARDRYFETDPMDPTSDYGRSKMGGEAAALSHSRSVSFRLGSGMGASPAMRWDVLAHDFLLKAYRGGEVTLYEPDAIRNFVHVRDVARAIRHVAENQLFGTYNLNHPDHYTKRDVAELAAKALATAGVGSRVDFIDGPGADADRRDGVIDPSAIRATGFYFLSSLIDGLQEVAAIVRDTGGVPCSSSSA